MATIKDLNNETIIDATKPPIEDEPSTNINKGKTVVNLNGMFNSNNNGNHTVVKPTVKGQQRAVQSIKENNSDEISIDMTANSGRRVAADLSSLPSQTPEEAAYAKEHFVDNPIDRIVGEGEDSILSKYLVHKEKELTDAYEQVKYNKELKELEEEAELTGDDSAVIDYMNKKADSNQNEITSSKVIVDDDDILSSLNTDKEEEVVSDNNEYIDDTENYDDSELDDDQLYPEDVSLGDELAGKYDENGNYKEENDFPFPDDENDDDPEDISKFEKVSREDPPRFYYNNNESIIKDEIEKVNIMNSINAEKVENPDIDLEVVQSNSTSNDIIDNIDTSLEVEDENLPEPVDESDDLLKKLQVLATEKLKPVSKRLDISSFTVVKKPISNTTQFNVNPVKAAKWVLMNQNATVLMREFTGAELERLREFTQDGNSVTSLTKRYRLIYDHIDSPKPEKFETWLKTTPFSDEDNYFFAIYIASFKGANYIPRDCSDQTTCKETWLTDDINIMDMVKFENNEAKDKFTKIYQEEDSSMTKAGLYVSEIVPLSDTVAVAFREPSIYTRIELSSLEQEFREKYRAILEFVPYIDSLYFINQAEGTLTPVGYKLFADNSIRTTKSKIQQFAKVLSTLSIDEFGTIRPYVNNIASRTNGLNYIYPECTCPKCGSVVPEVVTSAEELLFTRYQLGALVNTSLN